METSARRWYSVAEVAQMGGLAPMTVYRAIHAGRLPAMKIGRRYLIPARVLDAMEQAAVEPDGETEAPHMTLHGHSSKVPRR